MAVRNDLARLIAFPTVSNRPTAELAAFVASRFEALGFTVEEVVSESDPGKANLVCRIGPEGTDGLTISGHMDVVPTECQPWTSDPFTLTERDGRWYGRGTADMKGFFAVVIAAVERLQAARWARELVCVWTYDEEVGCLGSARFVAAYQASGRTIPSACLIGEPTDFQILRMHPGHVAVELTFHGQAAHSSRPDLGRNAVEAAAAAVLAIGGVADQLEQERAFEGLLERPWVAVNVARIEGGRAINIVPDHATVQVGYRPLPGMDAEAVHHRILDAIRGLPPSALRGVDWRGEVLRVTPALLTPAGTPLEGLLHPHACQAHVGAASFATDGGNLAKLGAKSLVFGPGSITVAHQADEHVDPAQLERAVHVVEDVIRRRCLLP